MAYLGLRNGGVMMALRRALVQVMAVTAVVGLTSLGISGSASAKASHHVKGGSGAATDVWSPTELTLPADAMPGLRSQVGPPQALACPASGSCVAVGTYQNSADSEDGYIDTLSDGVWTPTAAPTPDGSPGSELFNVTCPAPGACVAIGQDSDSQGNEDGFAATLSDGSWTATTLPVPPGAAAETYGVSVQGVTCAAVGVCVVVGSFTNVSVVPHLSVPFIDTLSDGSWTSTDVPLPSNSSATTEAVLTAVACSTTTSCVAVGNYDDNDSGQDGLLETLSDGSWTADEAPDPSTTGSLWLGSVACPGPDSCEAIGNFQVPVTVVSGADVGGTDQAVIETLSDGGWTVMYAPLPANAGPGETTNLSQLADLTCPAVGSCEAVGDYSEWWRDAAPDGNIPALIETLSDGTWTPTQAPIAPDAVTQPSELSSVSCASAGSCVAVGQQTFNTAYDPPVPDESDGEQVLIETLSDGVWTTSDAPLPPNAAVPPVPAQVSLSAVSCPALGSCAALGTYFVPNSTPPPYPPSLPEGLIETLGVALAPTISSADQATFTVGQSGSFTVTAAGAPVPAITEKGTLPKGLRFAKGKGSATISGTPKVKKPGSYSLTITASNTAKSKATQSFTLTVDAAT